MARFFFNLHERGYALIDEEGADFINADAARLNALHETRQLMAADISNGHLCFACHIEVQDETGNFILSVAFQDAIIFL